jgi:hypothetical protein
MGAIVAVGGHLLLRPGNGRIEFQPLLIILVAVAVVRLALGIRLTWPVALAVMLGATFLGGAIEAWGFGVPVAVALATGVIASTILHRRARAT